MILNGPTENSGFEVGYVGRTESGHKAVCIQFTFRQLGEGTRLIIIPVPGNVTGFMNTETMSYFLYDAINQGSPLNQGIPTDDVKIHQPENISKYAKQFECIAIASNENILKTVTSHWGSEVYINPSLEQSIRYYYPGWDLVVCKFSSTKFITPTPIGFYYDGPEITDGSYKYLYYPFIHNLDEKDNIFWGESPKIGTAAPRKFAIAAGVAPTSVLISQATSTFYQDELPEGVTPDVITYYWDGGYLLNGSVLVNESTGIIKFTADLNTKKVDGHTLQVPR